MFAVMDPMSEVITSDTWDILLRSPSELQTMLCLVEFARWRHQSAAERRSCTVLLATSVKLERLCGRGRGRSLLSATALLL